MTARTLLTPLAGLMCGVLAGSAAAAPTGSAAMTFQVRMSIISTCALATNGYGTTAYRINCSRGTPFRIVLEPDSGLAGTGAGMAAAQGFPFEPGATVANADSAPPTGTIHVDVGY